MNFVTASVTLTMFEGILITIIILHVRDVTTSIVQSKTIDVNTPIGLMPHSLFSSNSFPLFPFISLVSLTELTLGLCHLVPFRFKSVTTFSLFWVDLRSAHSLSSVSLSLFLVLLSALLLSFQPVT